ncbi:hypothetical protein DL96DRAFT_1757420, partial [Flagelloscypha sp. PMI_526]
VVPKSCQKNDSVHGEPFAASGAYSFRLPRTTMSLPLDLVPPILGLLADPDLEKCMRVTVTFRRIALRLLFTHLVLYPRTCWSKCTFLLGEEGVELRPLVKKITLIESHNLSLTGMDMYSPLLPSVLELVGSQLDAFYFQSTQGISWEDFPSPLLEAVTNHVLPHVHDLELNQVDLIPLLTTLTHCPHLQKLSLGSQNWNISMSEGDNNNDDEIGLQLPRMTSLVLNTFSQRDFGDGRRGPTSLKRFLLLTGSSIRSLTLNRLNDEDFPLKWDFLRPFVDLRNSLFHLSFGPHFYQTVVDLIDFSNIEPRAKLNFGMFSQLQSISFSISEYPRRGGWEAWSKTLAQSLCYHPQPKLNVLRFTVPSKYYPKPASLTNPLDDLAEGAKYEMHIVICGKFYEASFDRAVLAFRKDMPSWDEAGKLKFWVRE